MDVTFTCLNCSQSIVCDTELSGTDSTCPTCQVPIRIPFLNRTKLEAQLKKDKRAKFGKEAFEFLFGLAIIISIVFAISKLFSPAIAGWLLLPLKFLFYTMILLVPCYLTGTLFSLPFLIFFIRFPLVTEAVFWGAFMWAYVYGWQILNIIVAKLFVTA